MKNSSDDSLQRRPSTIRAMKLRYSRNKKRIAFIFLLVFTVLGFSTIGFFVTWPNERNLHTQPSLPVTTAAKSSSKTVSPSSEHLSTAAPAKDYLLNSPVCRVQDFHHFHSDVEPYFKKEDLETCTERPLLSSVLLDANGSHTLRLHNEHFDQYTTGTPISCCYSIMSIDFDTADLNDDSMRVGECQPLTENVLLKNTTEYVEVRCQIHQITAFGDNETVDIYKNVHAFVGLTSEVEDKLKGFHQRNNQSETRHGMPENGRDVSVMIIGIDSMSRLNFKRNMPGTYRYLHHRGWYPLNVYNRVGEDTLPNLAAILTGTDMDTLDSLCWSNESATIEDCPWIWNRFSEKGYITAYAEDTPQLDTFSRRKFSKSPTDYFLRPFMRAAERLSSTNWYEKYLKFFECLGPVHSAHHILKYSLEFAHTFKNHPTFSVFWLNTLSRHCLYCAGGWDEIFVSYLKELDSIRDDTLVIFMSDHGKNEGQFRQTRMGFYESNLPFIYFSLPRSYPPYDRPDFENLIDNENKLTSPFDIHVSLLEILGVYETAPSCPKCFSLFRKLPDRTCSDAGIPERYCACTEYDIVSDTNPYKYLGSYILEEVNKLRESFQNHTEHNKTCSYFHLKGLKTIQAAISPLKRLMSAFKTHSTKDQFLVTVQTNQDAIFEAVVSRDNNDDLRIESDIARIDQYEKHSKCMNHPEGKKYCYCQQPTEEMFIF